MTARSPARPPFPLLFAAVLLLGTASAQGPTWASPSQGPDGRSHHAIAYDAARGRTVLFGGYRPGAGALGDTWEWDGHGWIRRTPTVSPPARSMHCMAYDANRGVTVLFGGLGATWLADTWEWNGETWTQVVTAHAPPAPLEQPAMAWHGGTNPGCLLFGGLGAVTFSSQTWRFDGVDWTHVTNIGPTGRMAHAMAYATSTQCTYLHGGRSSFGNSTTLSDLWCWNGTFWAQIAPVGAGDWPFQLGYHAMTYDAGRNELVLVGGTRGDLGGPSGQANESTYYGLLSGPTTIWWFGVGNHQAALGRQVPPRRVNGSAAYDLARQRIVAFGGQLVDAAGALSGYDAVTYEVPPGGSSPFANDWVERLRVGTPSNAAPSARTYTEMAYDPFFGHSVLFGGWSGVSALGDTWTFDGQRWTNHGTGSVAPRLQPAMCYAPFIGTVLFGGGGGFGGPFYNDTLSWGGAGWFATLTLGAPTARYGHDMVFDAARNRVVMFGGYGSGGAIGTTDELRPLQFGFQWSPVATNGSPPARNAHRMAYDARRQRTVLFGGADAAGTFLGDTWEYDGATATWTQRFPSQSPPRRWNHVMEYDPARGVVVLSGGYGNPLCGQFCASHLDDVWEWNGVDWRQRSTGTTAPSGREGAGFAYDSARQRFVLQGGGAGTYPTETWLLNAPVDRVGQGMLSNAFPLRCTRFPVAGQPTGFSFASPDGFGWLAAHPEPSPAPLIVLGPTLLCDPGTVYAPPTILFDAHGNPGTASFVLPIGMVGQGFVVQGVTFQFAGGCLRISDPLAVTVQAP